MQGRQQERLQLHEKRVQASAGWLHTHTHVHTTRNQGSHGSITSWFALSFQYFTFVHFICSFIYFICFIFNYIYSIYMFFIYIYLYSD